MELGGKTDKNGNTTSYSFTFLGDKQGINGSGALAIINETIISDENLNISNDNMKVKLAKRAGDTVESYECSFSGYNEVGNRIPLMKKMLIHRIIVV